LCLVGCAQYAVEKAILCRRLELYQAVQANGGFEVFSRVVVDCLSMLFLFMLQVTSTACLGQNRISAATSIRDCFLLTLQASEVLCFGHAAVVCVIVAVYCVFGSVLWLCDNVPRLASAQQAPLTSVLFEQHFCVQRLACVPFNPIDPCHLANLQLRLHVPGRCVRVLSSPLRLGRQIKRPCGCVILFECVWFQYGENVSGGHPCEATPSCG
jgi:hypothetical protein